MKGPDSLWIEHMRLPKNQIVWLANLLRDELSPQEPCVREPVPLLKRTCIAVYKLATCSEYRVVGEMFGVSKVTVFRCVNAFSLAMSNNSSTFIKFPTTQEASEIADRIETKYGYPQAFAAIDGSHIAINPPDTGRADYLNRKMFPSIVLQGLVDDKYMFRDISCKCPGSMHDSTVFLNSSLAQRIQTGMPIRERVINGVNVPLHILGDPAYALSENIIKGYTGRNLTENQESFNVHHSSARIMVENAFGRLKARWRMVCKRMDCRVELSPYVIMACCCLHNLCESIQVPLNPNLVVEAAQHPDNQQPPDVTDQRIEAGGVAVRDAITIHLASSRPLRRSINH